MKKSFSFVFAITVLAMLLALSVDAFSAGSKKTFPNVKQATVTVTGTYVNAQVDTVVYNVEDGISTLAFQGYWADSVKITDIVVHRYVNGKEVKQNGSVVIAAGDTITNFSTAVDTEATGTTLCRTGAVTLAPLPEQIWFIVTYNNGLAGVTTPTYRYSLQKTYSK